MNSSERPMAGSIILVNRWREWTVSFALYVAIFLLMWEYHRWRGRPYSLFTANKALAIASSLLISLSLALGPLRRLTGKFCKLIRLRRPLGVIAVVFVVPHVIVSLFLVEKFDLTYYSQNWLSLIFGTIAFTGFLLLWVTSYERAFERLGAEKWKNIQRLGYIFLAFIILHIVVLGKIPNWILWFKTFNWPVPPGTMIPSVVAALVVLLKIVDIVVGRKGLLE